MAKMHLLVIYLKKGGKQKYNSKTTTRVYLSLSSIKFWLASSVLMTHNFYHLHFYFWDILILMNVYIWTCESMCNITNCILMYVSMCVL